MFNVKVTTTGRYVPAKVVTNNDISKLVETSDEWIKERTGIVERRISTGENTSDLAVRAAKKALDQRKLNVEELDLIIVATVTPDCFVPSTACIVQDNLGAKNATCFDINAACTGFIYAMNIASQFIKTGQSKKALVIGAEVLSKIVDWTDRNTCVLFGDGAGAAILERSDKVGLISQYMGSDGSKGKALISHAAPLKNAYTKEILAKNTIYMEGKEIFKFAVKVMEKCIKEVLERTEYEIQDIKYILPHQANMRIIEFTAKKLKIDSSRFYTNLDKHGNTSGASIPIALDEMNEKGLLKSGDKIILVGFGGGLTFGAYLIEW